jgi:hypothetical protein
MQWYVYLIATAAIVFLGHAVVELVSRPIQSLLRLRREALERMASFERISLPQARELAISSQAIQAYDLAVRNVREAHCIFHDLGTQLLALGESEPAVRILMNLFGLNVVLAGHALINLSQIYAMARIESDQNRRAIGQALRAASIALGAFRRRSRNELINIRLEPMHLREASYPRNRRRPLGRPPLVPHQPGIRLLLARQERPQRPLDRAQAGAGDRLAAIGPGLRTR